MVLSLPKGKGELSAPIQFSELDRKSWQAYKMQRPSVKCIADVKSGYIGQYPEVDKTEERLWYIKQSKL